MSRPMMLFAMLAAVPSMPLRKDSHQCRTRLGRDDLATMQGHAPPAPLPGTGRTVWILATVHEGRDCRWVVCAVSLQVWEEALDLALGRVHGVGSVHEVLPGGQREVAADGAGCGRAGVGGAVQQAYDLNGLVALEYGGHQRAAGDELAQRRVEVTLEVLEVVGVRHADADRALVHRH